VPNGTHGMTSKAWRAFQVYRDLGPQRSLRVLAEKLDYSGEALVKRWSALYEWQRLCTEHDHRQLREQLGRRSVQREGAMQQVIDALPNALRTILSIMNDDNRIPILNRDGSQMKDADGNALYRPTVQASTKLAAAQALAGIAGLVPVKRMEVKDTSGETLDEAAGLIKALTPQQVEAVIEAVTKDDDG
jgi:hypothetical protein